MSNSTIESIKQWLGLSAAAPALPENTSMKYLIVGLGNIGPEYAETRHNIGFMVLDYLAKKHDAQFDTGRHSFVTEIKTKGRTFVLVKPTTYMNLSGKAVQHWLSNLKLPVEQMMVITDDIAIPFGKIRIRTKGSAGGHNGLKHIEQTLGHNNYPRLRFGVGDSFHKGKQVDYVLSKFSDDESIELQTLIEKAADSVIAFGTIGLERTMNQYNTK
ncbi:PTH1 family peptidyl-tRNA hydrolase [Pontibacter aydingkolensis]